jgi:cyclopropane-fatty-acyl-phospholipid synthase
MSEPAAMARANARVLTDHPARAAAPGRAERALTAMLHRIRGETLDLRTPERQYRLGGGAALGAAPSALIQVHDAAVFARVLRSGDIGFAESYVDGLWTTPDLRALLACVMRQRSVLEDAVYGSFWGSLLHRLAHFTRRNTRAGSRRNIHAHYDLGNAFYALWLDASPSNQALE